MREDIPGSPEAQKTLRYTVSILPFLQRSPSDPEYLELVLVDQHCPERAGLGQDLTTRWDFLFRKYGKRLPVPLLRALAKRESNFNPNESGGNHWGILQVGINNVLPSYNKRRGTHYSSEDLFNPDINVKIATDLLNRITVAMDRHPDPNMKWNPSNPESVKLLLAGWNSGYSEAAGLGKVARFLEERGIPVTHENVFTFAREAGGTRFLQREMYDKKRRWQASVANLYFQQPDAPAPGASTRGFIMKASIAVLAGLLAARYVFK